MNTDISKKIEFLENKLEFYSEEPYDEDMHKLLSNDIMGTMLASFMETGLEFEDGKADGLPWSYYVFVLLKKDHPMIYARAINELTADESSVKENPLTLSKQRRLFTLASRVISSDNRTIIGRKVAQLTNEMMVERQEQIKELKLELDVLRLKGKG